MSILDLIANAATGGSTGIIGGIAGVIGSGINKYANYKDNQQAMLMKAQEYTQELALQKLQNEGKREEDTIALETATNAANTAMRTASYAMPLTSSLVNPIINNILSLIRPCITIGFIGITFFIWCRTNDMTLIQRITDTVLFLTGSSVSWWYGDRQPYSAWSKK